jgi:malonyl-ACP O-methyltransferase BioC
MNSGWVTNDGNPRVIAIFAGWAAGFEMFAHLSRPGYDIIVFWDYRDESFDSAVLSVYEEIFLIGWSMGVMEAERLLQGSTLPIVGGIAVNGTPTPVDDRYGIPIRIFEGTLSAMNPRNLSKFYRRMCANSSQAAELTPLLPCRPIDQLIDELRLIGERAATHRPVPGMWSRAVIGECDAIFPKDSQVASWKDIDILVLNGVGHWPDWQKILNSCVVDKSLVAERFGKSRDCYDRSGRIQRMVAERLCSLWVPEASACQDMLEVGSGTGQFTRLYLRKLTPKFLKLWDISGYAPDLPCGGCRADFEACDAERAIRLLPDCGLDCIASSSTVQWFNALPRFLAECARVLRSDGQLVLSTYGPDTYRELRAAGITLPVYRSLGSIVATLESCGFTVVTSTSEIIVDRFDSPLEAMRHIKLTGVNAIHRVPLSPSAMRQLLRGYPADETGKAPLTYQPIYIIARIHK